MFSHGVLQILIFVVALICYSSIIIEQQIIATTKIRIWKSRCQNISVHYHLPPLLLIYACSQSSYLGCLYYNQTLVFLRSNYQRQIGLFLSSSSPLLPTFLLKNTFVKCRKCCKKDLTNDQM